MNEPLPKKMQNHVGLALSGGGARGAYQAGVAEYLSEAGIFPDVFSGTSIGAFNAAVLAASSDMENGAERLSRIWKALRRDDVLKLKGDVVLWGLLFAAARISGRYPLLSTLLIKMAENKGAMDSGPITSLLEKEANLKQLQNGKPLWISVYETGGACEDLARILLAETGIADTRKSEYICVQELPQEEQLQAVLASASLPVAFDSRTVNGKRYRDGGIGGWNKKQGSTPAAPLLNCGCGWAIVVHLSDGSVWDRNQFDEMRIIEVRPKRSIHPTGSLKSLMDFSPDKITGWIEQGYEDAVRCIGNVVKSLRLVNEVHRTKKELNSVCKHILSDGFDEKISEL